MNEMSWDWLTDSDKSVWMIRRKKIIIIYQLFDMSAYFRAVLHHQVAEYFVVKMRDS